jgi:putative heme-binding domain-containing protein
MGGGAPTLRGKGLEAAYLFKTISNGLSGTPMRPFKSELSEEKIWQLVAYIMSPVGGGEAPAASGPTAAESAKSGAAGDGSPATPADSSTMTGDSSAGKQLFFDTSQSKSCQSCHTFQGMGASIGPDLSKLGGRSARELFLAIVLPGDARDQRYRTLTVTLKDGEKIIGVKKDEDSDSLRIYDVTELPAVLRTVQKGQIAVSEISSASPMPKEYARIYTLKQLLDLVAFLKSEAKGAIQLKGIL